MHERLIKKLLVALGTIAMQTHSPTKFTSDKVDHLLDYVATYPNDSILFRESKIQLVAHSEAGCLNGKSSKVVLTLTCVFLKMSLFLLSTGW